MNQRGLSRLKNIWQKRLNLVDWKIRVRVVSDERLKGLTGVEAVGAAEWSAERKLANLYFLPPERFIELRECPEEAVVHELLHVVYHGHLDTKPGNIHLERALEQVSKALVTGWRRRRRKGA